MLGLLTLGSNFVQFANDPFINWIFHNHYIKFQKKIANSPRVSLPCFSGYISTFQIVLSLEKQIKVELIGFLMEVSSRMSMSSRGTLWKILFYINIFLCLFSKL